MANEEHVAILWRGVESWNEWRNTNPRIRPDLSGMVLPTMVYPGFARLARVNFADTNLAETQITCANLEESNLRQANFSRANLIGSRFSRSQLDHCRFAEAELNHARLDNIIARKADFSGAKLSQADLNYSDFTESDFRKADLTQSQIRKANLSLCDLTGANLLCGNIVKTKLHGAKLVGADLQYCSIAQSSFQQARIIDCSVYGSAIWDLELDGAEQSEIRVTLVEQPKITVDNIEIAQFIYLILNNERIRSAIDTITSKVVLVLGRFAEERKAVLNAIKRELRCRDYSPVLFDFDKPSSRDITETVSTLAHLSRFVIADITDAKSIPQELQAIVPHLPSVPVQPLLLDSQDEYGMFEHFKSYPWVLDTCMYSNCSDLIANLVDRVIAPAEKYRQHIK